MATLVSRPAPPLPLPQRAVVAFGLGALGLGVLWLTADDTWRHGALLLIGALLGISLYHGAFGFTAAYRRALVERDISGMVAQLVMLGLAMVLFAPLLAEGEVMGQNIRGNVAPVGLQVAFGSFVFGIGMQLGSGCASGTLYTVGGGSVRMIVTLFFFCIGCFLGAIDLPRYAGWPGLGAISLGRELGFGLAVVVQLGLLAAFFLALKALAGAAVQRPVFERMTGGRLLRGPWPVLYAGIALALLNALTLVVGGHPWSVTWAFTLWGGHLATLAGWEPGASGFYSGSALEVPLLREHITIMNIGIMLGALTAAGLAGRFNPSLRIPPRSLAAAVIGGLMMGYGARLAFGCNIGAFFSGVASFSLHGWLWIVCALAGSWVGVRLRPWFGLAN